MTNPVTEASYETFPVSLWNIEFQSTTSLIPSYVFLLEEMGAAVAWEEDPTEGLHKIVGTLSFREEPLPTVESLTEDMRQRCENLALPLPVLKIEELPEKNWLAENRASFPPLNLGKFFIYGSHYKEAMPADKIPLHIDAAMAFGSGEHATTQGCLEALSTLSFFLNPHTCLDMGCGSGVLALAMAKLWPTAQVTACDNDPFAVNTTRENSDINKVHIQSLLTDGYQDLDPYKKFHLITANILAQPLCDLAKDAAKFLHPNGFLVLSGFYTHQVPQIVEAHTAQNLKVYQQFTINDWATIIVQAGV